MADAALIQALQAIQQSFVEWKNGLGSLGERIVAQAATGNGGQAAEPVRAVRVDEKDDKCKLYGKEFDMFRTFSGGEAEWQAWSMDFGMLVDTRSEEL